MTIIWDNQQFTMFLEGDTYWVTLPNNQMAPLGINITKDHAINRFFQMTYAYVYPTVGRILN